MLSVSLMLGQIYGFCPVLLRLSMSIFLIIGKPARFGRSVVCSWRVRCVLNAHPKIWLSN